MVINEEQVKLLQEIRHSRWSRQSLRPLREHWDYLVKFFQREKKIIISVLALILGQGVLEIVLVLISHQYLQTGSLLSKGISVNNLLILIVISIIAYLIVSFLAIKLEKTAIIRLINDLRARWYKLLLTQTSDEYNLEKKGKLLAKISYHLPMFSMGVTNCLVGLVRWLLFVFIYIVLCFVFGWKLLWWAVFSFVFSFIVAGSAFLIAKKYVIKETTFYSQIIKLVDFSLSDWQFTKFFRRENEALEDFNRLVDLDSYFRVRRELWLRFGASLVFVLLVLFSWFIGKFNSEIYSFLSISANNRFILVILIVYCSRLLYESLRVGLYSVPFLFGLSLSVPPKGIRSLSNLVKAKFKELTIQSAKTKLFKKSKYYKNLKFQFMVGSRYLITGDKLSGKTKLAKLLAGRGEFNRHAWIIKADKRRFFYNDFFRAYKGTYFIDPAFTSGRTLLEIVAGKEKNRLKAEDLLRIDDLIKSHPELTDLFFERADWRLRAEKFVTNSKSCLLLQIAYCLENKPLIVSLDNYWLDLNDPTIDSLLSLLSRELPDSILVFFASQKRSLLDYDAYYEI